MATQINKQKYNIDTDSLLRISGKVHVYWKDMQLNYLGSNDLMAEVNKLSARQDVLGRADNNLLWTEQAELYKADDRQVMLNNSAKQFHNFSILPDREITYLTIKVPLKALNGKTVGILGISHYLTERFTNCNLDLLNKAGIPINHRNFINSDKALLDILCKKYKLSKRQVECLYYLVRGMTLKQIGKTLKLSPRTVEWYLEIVKNKLNCSTKLDLINKCIAFGLGVFFK